MADTNKDIIDKAFKGYAEHIDKVVYNALDKWCVEILRKAIFERLNADGAHNFTGNLINSICVLLYRKSKGTVTTYFGYDKAGLQLPIRRELSGITARKTHRKNRVRFRVDWDQQFDSFIRGDSLIGTDESWGQNDAQQFAKYWLPQSSNSDFVICVAYTSEYASFVEHERQTTGILMTELFVERTAVEWVGLKAA